MSLKLIQAASQARERAYAPYSEFLVGAALEAEDGTLYLGCNIENGSYGLTLCAERVAIFKAVSEGCRSFRRLCVVADTPELTPPCGACRQVIWEHCRDIPIVLANLSGKSRTFTTGELMPYPFDLR